MNLASAAGPPASSIALPKAGSRICSVAIPKLKHYFTSDVKHCPITNHGASVDNKGMLNSKKMADLLIAAMDTAVPPVTSARLADKFDITPQAINGWRTTGRFGKERLAIICAETKKPYEYFLGPIPGSKPALQSTPDAQALIDKYQKVSPSHRLVVHTFLDAAADQRELLSEKILSELSKRRAPSNDQDKRGGLADVELRPTPRQKPTMKTSRPLSTKAGH
jgi:hypothetical protein